MKRLSIFMLAIMLILFILPTTQVFADGESKTVSIPEIKFDAETGITLSGDLAGDQGSAWERLYKEYRGVIAGVSGIGALTMIILFVIQFIKLASSAGNPQARSQALTGVLWTGLAATGLGAVSLITGFFYNII